MVSVTELNHLYGSVQCSLWTVNTPIPLCLEIQTRISSVFATYPNFSHQELEDCWVIHHCHLPYLEPDNNHPRTWILWCYTMNQKARDTNLIVQIRKEWMLQRLLVLQVILMKKMKIELKQAQLKKQKSFREK